MGFQVFPTPTDVPIDITSFGFNISTTPNAPTSNDFRGYAIYQISTTISPGIFLGVGSPASTSLGSVSIVFGSTAIGSSERTINSSTSNTIISLTTTVDSYAFWAKAGYRTNIYSSQVFSLTTARIVNYKLLNNTYHVIVKGNTFNAGESILAISTDFTSWTKNTAGFSTTNIVWGNAIWNKEGTYYLNNRNGEIFSSTDMVNWSTVTTTILQNSNYHNAYYDTTLGYHIMSGGASYAGKIFTSTDAINWTTGSLTGLSTSAPVYGVKRLNDYVFAVGGKNTDRPLLSVSTNGIDWLDTNPVDDDTWWSTQASPVIWDINYGNGFYFAPARTGQIIFSTDGINWTTSNRGRNEAPFLNATLYDDEYMFCYGQSSTASGLLWSTNGFNWSTHTVYGGVPGNALNPTTTNVPFINFAAYSTSIGGPNKYFLVGGSISSVVGSSSIFSQSPGLRSGSLTSINRYGMQSFPTTLIIERYNLNAIA